MKRVIALPIFVIIAYFIFLFGNKLLFGEWHYYRVILPVSVISIVYYFFVIKKKTQF